MPIHPFSYGVMVVSPINLSHLVHSLWYKLLCSARIEIIIDYVQCSDDDTKPIPAFLLFIWREREKKSEIYKRSACPKDSHWLRFVRFLWRLIKTTAYADVFEWCNNSILSNRSDRQVNSIGSSFILITFFILFHRNNDIGNSVVQRKTWLSALA